MGILFACTEMYSQVHGQRSQITILCKQWSVLR